MNDPVPLDADIGTDWRSRPGESLHDWDQRIRRRLLTDEQRRSEELADEWRQQEACELEGLDSLLLSYDVTDFLVLELPQRSARRARAMHVLRTLRESGHTVEYRHCDIRVNPPPSEPLVRAVRELADPLTDLLQEGF